MSADGSVIGGQMIDYTGLVAQPIVWREDDNGEWSYELLQPQLTNPSGEEFPPYPGEWEGGGQPVPDQFMTPEELDAWVNGMQTGGNPSPFAYMTEEEIDAYYAALNKHEEEIEEWETAWDKWNAVYSKVVSNPNMVNYQFNNVEMSSDGRYYLSTRINSEEQTLYPVVMDLENNDYRFLDGSDNLMVSGISDNYSVLSTWIDPLGVLPTRAYIYPELSDTAMALEEFVGQTSPEVATWMEDEMIRDVETATGGVTDFMCSGIPIASADLSLIITRMQVKWLDAPLGQWLYSYAFSTGIEPSGVENVAAVENGMTVLPNGDVVLNGEFKSLNIYNISGMNVFEATAPQGTVATNLDRGIYIYKAVGNDGKEIVRKIAL